MKILNVVLMLAMLLPPVFCVSCIQMDSVRFPTSASSSAATTDATIALPPEQDLPAGGITIATPYSTQAAEYIGMLYYARIMGVFPENTAFRIGDTVNLDELAQFRDSFPIHALQTGQGGAGIDQLRTWASSGTMPDIYLTDAVTRASIEGWAADLSGPSAQEKLISVSSIYPALAEGSKVGGRLYGIPACFSVPLLYVDKTLADKFGMSIPLAGKWDFTQFLTEAAKVQPKAQTDGGKTDAALFSATGLLAYLPAGQDSSLGWTAWNGKKFNFALPAFLTSAERVESLASSGVSADRMAGVDGPLQPEDKRAIYSGVSVMRIGDSRQLAAERNLHGNTLGLARLPYEGSERISTHVYSLCVSPNAVKTSTIVDFAAFFALDPDALLLAARFGVQDGFMPVSRDNHVWERLVGDQSYGYFLQSYRTLLDMAYTDVTAGTPIWTSHTADAFLTTEKSLLSGDLTARQAVDRLVAETSMEAGAAAK